tara:strand:+ start:259 stop:573 length:315 start_codon:yes stop_codon:yes gene_type:complete
MGKNVSDRRKSKRNYLKTMKKKMSSSEFKELKRLMAEEGKRTRTDELRESLQEEQDNLANIEGKKRDELKENGMSKKDIDKHIEDWYSNVKIWALHKDVQNELI